MPPPAVESLHNQPALVATPRAQVGLCEHYRHQPVRQDRAWSIPYCADRGQAIRRRKYMGRPDVIDPNAAKEADPIVPSADEEPVVPSADDEPVVPSADEEPVVPSADDGPVGLQD